MKKLIIFLFAISSTGSTAWASAKPPKSASKQAAASSAESSRMRDQFRQDFIKSTKEYQASLQAVAASYTEELNSLVARNATVKDLFNKGLVSRVDLDKSESAITAARARIDEVQKQVTSADVALNAAINRGTGASYIGVYGTSTDWTTRDNKIDQLIRYYGGRYNVDPYLIYLVMHQESGFSSTAASPKGAHGLMQLMPGTAARYGVTRPSDPAQNIMGGAHYLSDLLQLFNGNVNLALAGYNAGEGAVMKYGNRVPPYQETRYYVHNISSRYKGSN